MACEVKQHNLICFWEITYLLWNTILNNQIFYDLKRSDGSCIKKGFSILFSNYTKVLYMVNKKIRICFTI